MTPGTETIAVIGAGTRGTGIVQVVAGAGHPVILCDDDPKALEYAARHLRQMLSGPGGAGIDLVHSAADAARAHIVIEAIPEDLEAKRELFTELEKVCATETVFVSATSFPAIDKLSSALRYPDRFLGLHFFDPVQTSRLVEVVSGCATSPTAARRIGHLATNWGKHCVHSRSTPGFIVNRVARTCFSEALNLLQEQVVGPATLDAIMRESAGFEIGPLEHMDLIGHDVDYAASLSLFNASYQDPRYRPGLLQRELIDAGRLGRKSGRGFFDYAGDEGTPEPERLALHPPPGRVLVSGRLGIASSLRALFSAAGIQVEEGDGDGCIEFDDTTLVLTDGRTATERSATEHRAEMVLFDLALDYTTSKRIVVTRAEQCSDASLQRAAGLFQAIGKTVSAVDDAPGMVVMRTVCRLANEGADVVNQGVCEVKAVDRAMRHGARYPMGPLVWADRIGLGYVARTLDNIHRCYAEDRYRVSPLLRRKSLSGLDFYA